jgi:hypothetical protein
MRLATQCEAAMESKAAQAASPLPQHASIKGAGEFLADRLAFLSLSL